MVAAAVVAQAAKNRKEKKSDEDVRPRPKDKRPSVADQASDAVQDYARKLPKLPLQDKMKAFYHSPNCQLFVAGLIILNFFTTMAEKEFDPPFGERYRPTWQALEDAFNVVFLVELIINFWGSFLLEFWRSGWNIFDFIVVAVGTLGLLRVELPPEMSLLRTLRAFRVFRLFKRVKSLNKIITSLGRALPGVANAFVIMVIIMCIYAIIAVEWFAEFGGAGQYSTFGLYDGSTNEIDSYTGRGLLYGEEYYGTFTRALYTLWQVLTGESWSEAIARPLMFGYETPARLSGFKVGFYFTSFLILTQIVMVNVVVAVLLEKMVDKEEDEEEGDETDEEQQGSDELTSPTVSLDEGNGNGETTGDATGSNQVELDKTMMKKKSKTSVADRKVEMGLQEVRSDIQTLRLGMDEINVRLDVVDDLDRKITGVQDMLQQILNSQSNNRLRL